MAGRIPLVQGDTQPPLTLSLKDRDTGLPIDMSGATVRLKFRQEGETALQATVTGTLLAGLVLEDGTVDDTDDTPGAGGRVRFTWGTGDLDCDPGRYEGEVEITYSGGTVQTMYDRLKFKLRADF